MATLCWGGGGFELPDKLSSLITQTVVMSADHSTISSAGQRSSSPQKEPHWGDPTPTPTGPHDSGVNLKDAAAPLAALLDLLSDDCLTS